MSRVLKRIVRQDELVRSLQSLWRKEEQLRDEKMLLLRGGSSTSDVVRIVGAKIDVVEGKQEEAEAALEGCGSYLNIRNHVSVTHQFEE